MLPRWLSGKESLCRCWKYGFYPWVRKIPWRNKWPPILVFLPGKFHGQGSLAGYSPWGDKRLDMTEHTCTKCQVSEDTRWKTFSLYNLQTASKICNVLAKHQNCTSSKAWCTQGVDDFSQRSENLTVQQRAGANMFRNFVIGYYHYIIT